MWEIIKRSLQSAESILSLILGTAVVIIIFTLALNIIRNQPSETNKNTQTNIETVQTSPTPSVDQEENKVKSYTVQSGDTLWHIAETYYNSGYNWKDIQIANNIKVPSQIHAGQVLTIPDIHPAQQTTKTEISAASIDTTVTTRTYTVGKGDFLWDIAARQYGNGFKWVEIARINHLANPGLIHPGNVLILP